MKTFARHKTWDEIRGQCNAQGLRLTDRLYREHGWDTVMIEGGGGGVIYNTFNGKFFGTTPGGVDFNSSSSKFDEEPWFQALLSFFYVEK